MTREWELFLCAEWYTNREIARPFVDRSSRFDTWRRLCYRRLRGCFFLSFPFFFLPCLGVLVTFLRLCASREPIFLLTNVGSGFQLQAFGNWCENVALAALSTNVRPQSYFDVTYIFVFRFYGLFRSSFGGFFLYNFKASFGEWHFLNSIYGEKRYVTITSGFEKNNRNDYEHVAGCMEWVVWEWTSNVHRTS